MTHVALDVVLSTVVDVLDAHDVDYAVIGGLAVNAFGFARVTQTADVCLALDRSERDAIRRMLDALEVAGLRANRDAIAERLAAGRGLITLYMGLTRVDLFLRKPGDTWEGVLAHRQPVAFGGRSMSVASPEDVVAIKLLAGRPRDLEDVRGVLDIKRGELDVARLRATVATLAHAAGRPDLPAQLDALLTD